MKDQRIVIKVWFPWGCSLPHFVSSNKQVNRLRTRWSDLSSYIGRPLFYFLFVRDGTLEHVIFVRRLLYRGRSSDNHDEEYYQLKVLHGSQVILMTWPPGDPRWPLYSGWLATSQLEIKVSDHWDQPGCGWGWGWGRGFVFYDVKSRPPPAGAKTSEDKI